MATTTIRTTTDLLPLFAATREQGEIVEIEIHAAAEEAVRAQLLDDCEGRNGDTYLFAGENVDGDATTWRLRVANIFGC